MLITFEAKDHFTAYSEGDSCSIKIFGRYHGVENGYVQVMSLCYSDDDSASLQGQSFNQQNILKEAVVPESIRFYPEPDDTVKQIHEAYKMITGQEVFESVIYDYLMNYYSFLGKLTLMTGEDITGIIERELKEENIPLIQQKTIENMELENNVSNE